MKGRCQRSWLVAFSLVPVLVAFTVATIWALRKVLAFAMCPATLARAIVTVLVLTSTGPASAHGDHGRPHQGPAPAHGESALVHDVRQPAQAEAQPPDDGRSPAHPDAPRLDGRPLPRGAAQALNGGRPLAFEANRGQADAQAKYLARGPGYAVFLTPGEAVISLRDGRSARAVVRVRPVGANADARLVADEELPGVVNYARRAAGATPISAPTYARVRYADLYPGIDLVYYGRPRHLEYDFLLAPGADPDRIALAFDGADRVEIDSGGDLILHTGAGALRQPRPVVYQEVDGARRPVAGDYDVDREGHVRIRLGAYDRSLPVVIDPVLAYSTYLGGTGSEGDSGAASIAVDAAGNAYVTGTTESVDFPTAGGGDPTAKGGLDIYVTKLSPTGAVLYSTYLGGPCDDIVHAIAIDTAGNAYITGGVGDALCNEDTTQGALVAKLDPTGTVAYSTILGGGLVELSMGRAIAVDAGGHVYVTGTTSSPEFPTTAGALRTEKCADEIAAFSDGFVVKLSDDGNGLTLAYGTFLCGTGDDVPSGIAVDAAGHAYVAGTTGSHDFPTANPIQASIKSSGITGVTGFIAKLTPDGSDLVYSTYFGGSERDVINGLALDGQGNVYVTGDTQSLDYPTTLGVLQEHAKTNLLNQICGYATLCYMSFVTKIDASGSTVAYSTYLYGEMDHLASGIAVDAAGNAHIVGWTNSSYFPVKNAFQWSNRGREDAFVAKLSADGTRLLYSSYIGGSHEGADFSTTGYDEGSAIALDAAGNAYVVGGTVSYDFPTTPGAFQPALADSGTPCDYFETPCSDAFVAKITAGGPGVVPPISITASVTDIAPGGTVIATWAVIPSPSDCDFILLHALGSGRNDWVAYWLTDGTAAGALSLTLPADLPPDTYELRLLTPVDGTSCYAQVSARSEPFRVAAAAAPDLVVTAIATTPAQPASGQSVAVTVTVTNQGTAPAGAFAIDFYKDRATAPGAGLTGDLRCDITSLAPSASAPCAGSVTYAAAGTYSAWAQVDTGQAVAESSEGNNVFGPRAITVAAPAGPDLVVTALSEPPGAAAPGSSFPVTDTVMNQGGLGSAASTTRYYLSLDQANGTGDVLLTGGRSVPALAVNASYPGAALTMSIPTTTALGLYYLVACADDPGGVIEISETNNCRASTNRVQVTRPDLVVTALSEPPGVAAPGSSFPVTDTVMNQGGHGSAASTTRYYLSLDQAKGTGDVLLTGGRSVPALAVNASYPGAALTMSIPTTTALGLYYLVACADDPGGVIEISETNNCRASTNRVQVTRPDLVVTALSEPPGVAAPGSSFPVTDTVMNQGGHGSAASTTRYYLSLDQAKGTGDVLLIGGRSVPALAVNASYPGTTPSVGIPVATPLGLYYLLACADDLAAVVEIDNANNCRASSHRVQVTRPDLVVTLLSDPPATAARGTGFQITDTVANQGGVASAASTTRYYLSLDKVKGSDKFRPPDMRL